MLKKYRNVENKSITIVLVLSLLSIYGLIIISSIIGVFGDLYYDNFGNLTLISVVIFILISFASILKEKYYFLFLVFVLLALPSPIDDIFPSVRFSNIDDSNFAVFPLVTRIDLFLILGILIKLGKIGFKLPQLTLSIFHKIFILLAIPVFYLNLVFSEDFLDVNLILSHTFHIRYYILTILLLSLYDISKYSKEIVLSFVISITFLTIEAYVNTQIKGMDRLTSGSLSLNTFANISASITLFFLYLRKKRKISLKITLFVFTLFLIIIIGSGTRAAFLSFITSFFILAIIESSKKLVINVLKTFFIASLVFYAYFYASNNNKIPQRYSYTYLSKKIHIDLSEVSLNKIFRIKRSWETNSLVTRLDLFESSLNMVYENPVLGVGAGRWNRYKNYYSKNEKIEKVLLDTHNDYLALLSQYGIVLGFVMSYLVFLYPRKLFNSLVKNNSPLKYLYVIPFSMGISAFSNSGFFKHQVAAILILCLVILTKLHNDKNE